MPAAVAIPAVASLVGTAISAVGQHKTQNAAAKQKNQEIADAKAQVQANYDAAKSWQAGVMPSLQDIFQQAMAPQESSGTSSTTTDMLTSPELAAAAQPDLQSLLMTIRNIPMEANLLLPEQKAAAYRTAAQTAQAGNAALRNRAAATGTDMGMLTVGSPVARNQTNALLAANQAADQQAFQNKMTGATAMNEMLGKYFLGQRQKGKTSQSFKNIGPANYGAGISALGMTQPIQKDVIY